MTEAKEGLRGAREIVVSWGDCDPAGIVFYPRYYEWFDASTHALLTGAGLDHHTVRAKFGALGTPLVSASARFVSPATYGDALVAESWVSRVGTKSFTVSHRMRIGDRVVVEGEEARVWAEGEGKGVRAAEIPPAVRAIFEGSA